MVDDMEGEWWITNYIEKIHFFKGERKKIKELDFTMHLQFFE